MRGRGIDTPQERNAIEYRPKLRYERKELILPTSRPRKSQKAESSSLDDTEIYSTAGTLQEILALIDKINSLITYCESKLATKVVQIDVDKEPHVSEAIARVCPINKDGVIYNNDKINLSIYNNSVKHNDADHALVARRYENEMAGLDGMIEGEALKLLRKLKSSYEDVISFIKKLLNKDNNKDISSLIPEISDEEDRAVERYNELLDKYFDLKEHIESEELNYEEYNAIQKAISTIEKELKRISTSYNSIGKFSYLIHTKTSSLFRWYDKLDSTIKSTVSDTFNDMVCCFLKKIFNSVEINVNSPEIDSPEIDLDGLDEKIENINKVIDGLKVVLTFGMDKRVKVGKYIDSKLDSLLDEAMTSAQNAINDALFKLKTSINEPIVEFLDKLVSDYEDSCLPVEQMANLVMDIIEEIEEKYTKQLVNMCQLDDLEVHLFEERLENLYEKKVTRDFYNLLDTLQSQLQEAYRWYKSGKLREWIISFIENNNFNTSYIDGVIEKISDFNCEEFIRGRMDVL
jgi:tetratricopeptide (TPR) repeat protein